MLGVHVGSIFDKSCKIRFYEKCHQKDQKKKEHVNKYNNSNNVLNKNYVKIETTYRTIKYR